MKRNSFFLALVLQALTIGFLTSCGKESKCFKNTGVEMEEVRSTTVDISSIYLNDNVDLRLVQSNISSISVIGGENLIPYIKTEIEGNSLTIKDENSCKFLRDYNKRIEVIVTSPRIAYISYEGNGNITSTNDITGTKLEIETFTGTGDIDLSLDIDEVVVKQHAGPAAFNLKGKANSMYLFSAGFGWFSCENLWVDRTHVNSLGSGDMEVRSNLSLNIELRSLGNVTYYGNPASKIITHIGSGAIIQK